MLRSIREHSLWAPTGRPPAVPSQARGGGVSCQRGGVHVEWMPAG